MVKIVDSAKQKFGFELTARLATNITGAQAGDFINTSNLTQILCASGVIKPATGCGAAVAIQFIEHSGAGYQASTTGSYTHLFDWPPPSTNIGDIDLYVAAHAGPG